jgi:hypothetical protein
VDFLIDVKLGARVDDVRQAQFPWSKEAPIGKLLNLKLPHPGHLYWPDLNIDLSLDLNTPTVSPRQLDLGDQHP